MTRRPKNRFTNIIGSFLSYVLNHKGLATTTIIIVIFSLFSVSILAGSQSVFKSYPSGATLNVSGDFAFFKDVSTTIRLTSIDFGSISIGHNYETVYAKNLGNINITLVISVTSKNSSISSVKLLENYSGTIISPAQTIPILFDMFALPNATFGLYSFMVNVYSE